MCAYVYAYVQFIICTNIMASVEFQCEREWQFRMHGTHTIATMEEVQMVAGRGWMFVCAKHTEWLSSAQKITQERILCLLLLCINEFYNCSEWKLGGVFHVFVISLRL